MMCARFLKPEDKSKHGRLYHATERMFENMLGATMRPDLSGCCAINFSP